jgi:hypothetical protein
MRVSNRTRRLRAAIVPAIALTLSICGDAGAQPKTDVVTLANGDRITGEVKRLERGRLDYGTDDAGTLSLEWDKLASVVSSRLMEVATNDGSRYLGTLQRGPARSLSVAGLSGTVRLPMSSVTFITPIGTSFWRKLDGSLDAGFSYTRSGGVAQLNFNTNTVYRRPAFEGRLTAWVTLTRKDDGGGRDDRGTLEASYLRYVSQRWFLAAAGRFETNESLGLELRTQVGAAVGPRLINTNRAQMALGAGLVVNDERGVGVEPTQNLEGLFLFRTSYFTYDTPKTNVDLSLQYYPSLNRSGRQRIQLDASAKREIWNDLFVALSVYNTYDSRPPSPSANQNDVGVVASIGWSY